MRFIRVVVTSPSGTKLDITTRLGIAGTSGISFSPEDNLGRLNHGSLHLDLRDDDDVIRSFFRGAQPTDPFDIVVYRERDRQRERIFGGTLDMKSLSYNRTTKVASISAWSYSKLLEQTPADTIKRTMTPKTASINSNSKVIAFLSGGNQTSDIVAGDVIELTNSVGDLGKFTVDLVVDSETVWATEVSSQVLTDCVAVVTTPFYRDLTPAAIVGLIGTAVGMSSDLSDLSSDLASFPIPTPLVVVGGASIAQPTSLVPHGTTVIASYDAVDSAIRKVCASPSTPWTAGSSTNDYETDWTPYLSSEPGTIYSRTPSAGEVAASCDCQIQATGFVFGGGLYPHYVAECTAYATGLDTTAGDRWQLFADTHVSGPTQFTRLSIYKNGVSQAVLEDVANSATGASHIGTFHGWIDFDTFNKLPVYSYQYVPRGSTDPTIRKLGTYCSTFSAPVVRTLDAAKSGQVRFSRTLTTNGCFLFYDCPISLATGSAASGTLYVYDVTQLLTFLFLGQLAAIPFNLGYPQLWTARYLNGIIYFLFQQGNAIRLALYDSLLFTLIAAYTVSDQIKSFRCYLTLFKLSDGRTIVASYGGGEWFVVSLRYDGVVRYADFENRSCGDAISQLAAITNSVVDVDVFRLIKLANRRALGRGDSVRDLDVVSGEIEIPVSEVWRSSVQVTGKLNTGGTIDETVGDVGDSANRLSIDSPLVSTPGMAIATGIATLQFVSAVRSQRNLEIRNIGSMVKFGDRVTREGISMVAYKGDLDLESETQQLTLLEVIR